MKLRYKHSLLIIGFAVLALSACVTQKYERPKVVTDNLYRDQNTTDTATLANLPWQNLFTDANLQTLIQQGLNENLDLKQAIERIKIAQATLQQSKSAFLPSLQGDV
ncbi:MAG: TolC family protein, partial [Pedobacter sp.]|uniref:TolC family protein n=1 Tax=Pedobacter sp. TaxID=1411316 RepID=UPI0035616D6D